MSEPLRSARRPTPTPESFAPSLRIWMAPARASSRRAQRVALLDHLVVAHERLGPVDGAQCRCRTSRSTMPTPMSMVDRADRRRPLPLVLRRSRPQMAIRCRGPRCRTARRPGVRRASAALGSMSARRGRWSAGTPGSTNFAVDYALRRGEGVRAALVGAHEERAPTQTVMAMMRPSPSSQPHRPSATGPMRAELEPARRALAAASR